LLFAFGFVLPDSGDHGDHVEAQRFVLKQMEAFFFGPASSGRAPSCPLGRESFPLSNDLLPFRSPDHPIFQNHPITRSFL